MKKRIFALILCASLMTGEMTFWQDPVVKAETVSGLSARPPFEQRKEVDII